MQQSEFSNLKTSLAITATTLVGAFDPVFLGRVFGPKPDVQVMVAYLDVFGVTVAPVSIITVPTALPNQQKAALKKVMSHRYAASIISEVSDLQTPVLAALVEAFTAAADFDSVYDRALILDKCKFTESELHAIMTGWGII